MPEGIARMCAGFTADGKPCPHAAQAGGEYCWLEHSTSESEAETFVCEVVLPPGYIPNVPLLLGGGVVDQRHLDVLVFVFDADREELDREILTRADGHPVGFAVPGRWPFRTLFHRLDENHLGCQLVEGGPVYGFTSEAASREGAAPTTGSAEENRALLEGIQQRNEALGIAPLTASPMDAQKKAPFAIRRDPSDDGREGATDAEQSPGAPTSPDAPDRARPLSSSALPFQTGEETRALTEAIANGRHGTGYRFIHPAGGTPMAVYKNPARQNGHEVRVSPPDGVPWGVSELEAMTRQWDLATVHVAIVVAAMLAVNAEKHAGAIARGEVRPTITVEVDEILEAMGRRRVDGAPKWNDGRRMVRQRLQEISRAAVVGRRKKTYTDRETKTAIDTYQNEALFTLVDEETEWLYGQQTFDGSGIPVQLAIVGGSLWQRIARHQQMRQYIGEVRTLARLPVGQPSGQWAFSILCAVLQQAREKKTQELKMTRKELLLTIPPDETPQMLWDKGKSKKIKPRWRDALALLGGVGVTFAEPPEPEIRYAWLLPWEAQELEICVADDLIGGADLPALAATAASHADRESRPKRKSGRPRRGVA